MPTSDDEIYYRRLVHSLHDYMFAYLARLARFGGGVTVLYPYPSLISFLHLSIIGHFFIIIDHFSLPVPAPYSAKICARKIELAYNENGRARPLL